MKLMTYSINRQGEFKEKKVLDMQKYTYYDCGGSKGIDLKNKKNGKILYLYTEEYYEFLCEEEYKEFLPMAYKKTYIKVEQLNELLSYFEIF